MLHPNNYTDLMTGNSPQIECHIKDFSSIPDLEQWYNKHKDEILQVPGDKYLEIKNEYDIVISTYSLDNFKEIIKLIEKNER